MFVEGSASLRMQPLEAALSRTLAESRPEVKLPQRERKAAESHRRHGNTTLPIFKPIGEWPHKVRVCTRRGGALV